MFGELWTKGTVMVDMERMNEDEDLESQSLINPTKKVVDTERMTEDKDSESPPLLTPTKKICFQDKGSILKGTKKDTRSNLKPKNKRGIFRKMVFKTYLQLSLPIAIQHVT